MLLPIIKTLLHFLKWSKKKYEIDYFIILQPTSPFRSKIDILKSIKKVKSKNFKELLKTKERINCVMLPFEALQKAINNTK